MIVGLESGNTVPEAVKLKGWEFGPETKAVGAQAQILAIKPQQNLLGLVCSMELIQRIIC